MRFLNTARCRRGLLVLGTTLSSVSVAAPGSVVTDGTLGTAQSIAGPNYAITQAFGQIVGSNLFHSFGTFNIGTGESATFSSVTPVSNVIARVTGSASSIDGLIASTISGANLFLINPRGISFGPNASFECQRLVLREHGGLPEIGNHRAIRRNHSRQQCIDVRTAVRIRICGTFAGPH